MSYTPHEGGVIKIGDPGGQDMPGMFERVAKELRKHPDMWAESIRVVKYPSNYHYLPHGFVLEIELMPKDKHKDEG